MEEITGTLTQVIFYNEENGYTIAEMETEDELITIVGGLPYARPGTAYRLEGKFHIHPKYGEQFSFSHAEEAVPTTAVGIREFLASGTIKGIGAKTAAAIVDKFGDEALDIIESAPDRLTEVDGIGRKKAEQIAESYAAHREFADVALEFGELGLTSAQSLRLYLNYGKDAVKLVKENPYRLIDEVRGIGFRKADQIAEAMGVGREDPMRIASGIKAFLNAHANDGNTYMPRIELVEQVAEFLDVTRELVDEGIAALAFDGSIMPDRLADVEVIYLYPYYAAEKKVVANLAAMLTADVKPLMTDLKSSMDMTEADSGVRLSENQRDAVTQSVLLPVSVITGGPGTGKTTIINSLIGVFETSGFEVALAAPTGHAAKRMQQTTGHPASTVHRMLEYARDDDSGDMYFMKNEDDPLDKDVVIVDEASMIDLMLMKGLTDALRPGTRLILVGDADQLPSVGAGNVLRDIIASGMIRTVKLTHIFRQAEESMIVVNAHRINSGEYPLTNVKDKDFFFMTRKSEQEMLDLMIDLVTKRLPDYYKELDPLSDIQVLTPTHKGTVGTDSLNKALQDAINPAVPGLPEKKTGGFIFRQGDKVMQIKNDYDIELQYPGGMSAGKGVFNGDVGEIISIDNDDEMITVRFDDDRFAEYDASMLDELELAYAMTVHKSQGNEFPVIVMPITRFAPMLATRNLLYTAITRGEQAVVLVGSRQWLNAMVDNDRITLRYSGLEQRLSDFRAVM